jgi:hypothetical protein
VNSTVTVGDAMVDIGPNKFDEMSANTGAQMYALSVGQVTFVDYEAAKLTIRTQTGETLQFNPQALSFPGAGHRHFLGAMPEVNDVCLLGWGMAESGRTRTPYVLGWFVPGMSAGHDWLPTQPYSPGDFGFTATDKARFESVADRIRHKMRHMEPGDLLGSSSRGADFVLNESVLMTNRRGNEIHIRDQDQAIVMRSCQQFHALSGARVYAGMVQRDSTLLPSQMFSDGIDWAGPRQVDGAGNPLMETDLGVAEIPVQGLTPADVYQKDRGGQRTSGIAPNSLDPYVFLQRGLFIGPDGQALENAGSEAVYGGKPMFRVSTDGSNAVIDPNIDTLTEYRIEVSHTADGTLPVTEQTDGFDADRLPESTPNPKEPAPLGGSANAPFVEWVMGSVVGNDPFNQTGRDLYGVPLRPMVFDGDTRSPGLVSGFGTGMEEHAATMVRVSPPFDTTSTPSFWCMTKDGRSKVSMVGPGGVWSAEHSYASGLRVGAGTTTKGESVLMDTDGTIRLHSVRGDNETNWGVDIASDKGAIRISGGGSTTVGRTLAASVPVGEGERGLAGVLIESATNIHINASKTLKLTATQLDLRNVSNMNISGNSAVAISSGDTVSTNSKVIETTAMGKVSTTISGPPDSLPTNMPVRNEIIAANPATGNPGGPTDVSTMLYGDRVQSIGAGNHLQAVAVGNQVFSTGAGTVTHQAATSAMNLSPGGINGVAGAGGVTFSAPGGGAAISASAGVGITAATTAITSGAVLMPGAHIFPGGVMTDTTINPLTGLPWVASGSLGVPTVRVGA